MTIFYLKLNILLKSNNKLCKNVFTKAVDSFSYWNLILKLLISKKHLCSLILYSVCYYVFLFMLYVYIKIICKYK